jgi:precorrin-3B C17-methyltransferase
MFTLLIIGGKGIFKGDVCERSMMNIAGVGPGSSDMLTFEARRLLAGSAKIFGAERYQQEIKKISNGEMVVHQGSCEKKIAQRLKEAQAATDQGWQTCILTGGDPSIFSSSWRIMEGAGASKLHVSSGISAFSAVAARAGAPLVNDFVLIAGDGDPIRIQRLAEAGFGVAIYNVAGQNLKTLLDGVENARPCALARDVTRAGETVMVMSASELGDLEPSGHRFTLLIASEGSYIIDGKIITKRGYQARYSYG